MKVLIYLLKFWRYCLSPFFGCNCRFAPSCSLYMEQSLVEHGLCRGIYYGLCRICRCNSLSSGGYDPVLKRRG